MNTFFSQKSSKFSSWRQITKIEIIFPGYSIDSCIRRIILHYHISKRVTFTGKSRRIGENRKHRSKEKITILEKNVVDLQLIEIIFSGYRTYD